MSKEVENAKRLQGSQVDVGFLQQERRTIELKLMQARARLEDVRANLKVKGDIFNEGQKYEEHLFSQLKSMQEETNTLTTENRLLSTSANEREEIAEKIKEAKKSRDEMDAQLRSLMRMPFIKAESDEASMKRLDELQAKLATADKQIAESSRNNQKTVAELNRTIEDMQKTEKEKKHLESEITSFKAKMDPTSLTLSDVMKKLKNEDETRFREVMGDLEYDGSDPDWYKAAFMDQIEQTAGDRPLDEGDAKSLQYHKDKHVKEKAKLAEELVRTQNLLKIQVGIDKEN
jgi:septal ring factor EnvC (AmiA/AmiB activator)